MRNPARIGALRDWFGIDRSAAKVLASLFENSGEPLSVRELSRRAEINPASVKARVWELRTILATEALDTRRDGYALTDVGLSEVLEALHQVSAEIIGDLAPAASSV